MASSAVPAPLREIGFDQNLDRLLPLMRPPTNTAVSCGSASIL
jgi:hypothetical protein